MQTYTWPSAPSFIGRTDELASMERWWASASREPLNLYGRRRVGKSWLFRMFAHHKPALVLVAERTTPGRQMEKFSQQLAEQLGVTPRIEDLGDLFDAIFAVSNSKCLVVIDEFPYLLGSTQREIDASLSKVQASMERHRDSSPVKIVLCGSAVAQMEDLQTVQNPLHGRLQPLALQPLPFSGARLFMPALTVDEQLVRYSISGGMPRYLEMLSGKSLVEALTNHVVDRNSPLFSEPPNVLQSELREVPTYFAILSALSSKPAGTPLIAEKTSVDVKRLGPYLRRLQELKIIRERGPAGAKPNARDRQWVCEDDFFRFWFRFVAPYKDHLESGASAHEYVVQHVLPGLPDHTAQTFERVFRRYVRQQFSGPSQVDSWWGHALNEQRKTKQRFTEEIDVVGLSGRKVHVAGEAKWTTKSMPVSVLRDLQEFKLPAMAQAGFVTNEAQIVMCSRKGFAKALLDEPVPGVEFVDAQTMLTAVT